MSREPSTWALVAWTAALAVGIGFYLGLAWAFMQWWGL
jgi:hypothetical protein